MSQIVETPAALGAGDEIASVVSSGRQPKESATHRDRGAGPFTRLVLRGATVIDGTGSPAWGPVDIVVEGSRISEIRMSGAPGTLQNTRGTATGEYEIDCHGKFVTPGFIDAHAHIGSPFVGASGRTPPADYVYKLWLAHGITTVREMGCFNGLSWTLDQKAKADNGAIAAPRIFAYAYFPAVNDMLKTLHTPKDVKDWLRRLKDRGADGVKFFGAPPTLMRTALEECMNLGLRSGCHHAQTAVARMNALTTAEWGLGSVEHYYGLPEALFENRIVQNFPSGYNYSDEYLRFSVAGQVFRQAAQPGSAKWNEVLNRFLDLNSTFVPTLNIYDANRDLMRSRRADWHEAYTWKSYWDNFHPSRGGHGSYWHRWSTKNEIEWKENFNIWMQFINDYKNLGGRVCAGSDSGFIFQIFGFGFIRELEMLQEAGFHPLEVLRTASLEGARLLGIDNDCGVVEVGKRADLLVHSQNPLEDLKLLFGTGTMRLDHGASKFDWQRCLMHTIAGGICYDVNELLDDVRLMVKGSYADEGLAESTQ